MNIFLQIKIQNQGHVRGEHTFTMCDYVTLCDHVSSYHAPHLQHSSVCHYLNTLYAAYDTIRYCVFNVQ